MLAKNDYQKQKKKKTVKGQEKYLW